MDLGLDGKACAVTGSSSGIGLETARMLCAEGARVLLVARNPERLAAAADACNEAASESGGAETFSRDVTDADAGEAIVNECEARFGGLDVLVNNAGLGRGSGVEDLSTEDYRTMMDVNVDGCFFATRAALPHLRETEGNLVFIGSFAGQYPRPSNPVYAATKWWLRGFALSVSAAVGESGVAVSVVNPSEVRTEFGGEESFEERFEEGEVTEPDEVAAAVAFAARQDRSMVSELDLYRRDKFSGF
jgi:NADP-dependent 3-hydroxy acid dehydrogenase YdfG